MDYKSIIENCKSSNQLISMTPLKKIVELGYYLNIDEDSKIIDFCCGYGEMLRIWSDAYGSSGLGIEIYQEYVLKGNERIKESCLEKKVQLLNTDAKSYKDTSKYDVVCLSGENLLGDLESNIKFLESFLKSEGRILIGSPYYTSDIVPKELIEFEGQLNTLMEIYKCVRKLGYNLIHFSTGDHQEWERYISWSARRDIESLKSLTTEKEIADKQQWIDYWHKMYFEYRRNHESWGMFIIEK